MLKLKNGYKTDGFALYVPFKDYVEKMEKCAKSPLNRFFCTMWDYERRPEFDYDFTKAKPEKYIGYRLFAKPHDASDDEYIPVVWR